MDLPSLTAAQVSANNAIEVIGKLVKTGNDLPAYMWAAMKADWDLLWAPDRSLFDQTTLITMMLTSNTTFVDPETQASTVCNNLQAAFEEAKYIIKLVQARRPDLLENLPKSQDGTMVKYLDPGWILDTSYMPIEPVQWLS